MEQFNGMQYLAIDVANTFGLDKELWSTRIKWVKDNLTDLESLNNEADEPLLFKKAVIALRKAQKGEAINHTMALDCTASGLQIMAALSGCKKTAMEVNLIDPDVRKDVYTSISKSMSGIMGHTVERKRIKNPIMTYFYGSTANPKEVFGDDTPELRGFYKALRQTLPGACDVLNILRESWRSDVTEVSLRLPDGHKAIIPVIEKDAYHIQTESGMNFMYETRVNKPSDYGISIMANTIHAKIMA